MYRSIQFYVLLAGPISVLLGGARQIGFGPLDGLYAFLPVFVGIIVLISLISSVDELFVDLVYFLRVLPRSRRYRPEYTESFLSSHSEKPIAILIPAWHEAPVIRRMLDRTVHAYRYGSYAIFVGTYSNDPETQREVDGVSVRFPQVHKVVLENPGPTCKADCLNEIYAAVLHCELQSGVRFEIFVQHDSEDVVHPLELKVFNLLIPDSDMVQLPIYSGKVPWNSLTGGHYVGEFYEQHVKLMPVRDLLTGSIPGAGVGCGFSRRALEAMAARCDGMPFNTRSLAEDYDLALRLGLSGYKTRFVSPVSVSYETERIGNRLIRRRRRQAICTRGLFPNVQRLAISQKSRWILGICLQGWESMGWAGGWWNRYMLFRDRKGMVTSLSGLLGYAIAAWMILARPQLSPAIESLYVPLLILAGWRLLMRAGCVYAQEGWHEAILSLPRTIFANWVNFRATCRAIRRWWDWKVHSKPLSWEKTAHQFPPSAEIGFVRPRIGDLLLDQKCLRLEELETALDRQSEDPRPIGEILVDLGFVDDRQVRQALSAQAPQPASGD